MRNKIPCSADRLSLLDPPMIQGVVDRNAFRLGNQYLSENRVRIVEADEAQISSAVIGNSGLYEQSIRLKDGYLVSKCSCALPEEPMCRHCIAVLLEYYRCAQPRANAGKTKQASPAASTRPGSSNGNGPASSGPSAPADVKLSEVMAFIEWLQPAMKALEQGQPLPDTSRFTGDIGVWVQAIRRLDERRRESEGVRARLESEQQDREAYIARMSQQLQTAMAEVKAAQASCHQFEQEIATYKDMFVKVTEIASEVGGYDSQIKSIAGELLSKGSQLDKLANSFREVTAALKTVSKSDSSR
jgi:prefoldin subunit 5